MLRREKSLACNLTIPPGTYLNHTPELTEQGSQIKHEEQLQRDVRSRGGRDGCMAAGVKPGIFSGDRGLPTSPRELASCMGRGATCHA